MSEPLTIGAILLSGLGIMGSVVVFLFKLFMSQSEEIKRDLKEDIACINVRLNKTEQRADECEKDRINLHKQMTEFVKQRIERQ